MSVKRPLIWTALVHLLCLPTMASDEGLHWETDLSTAQRVAQQTHRLVLIHFGGPWCPPCQRLEHQVFSQPGFGGALVANYVAVKVDPQQDPATAKKYGIEKVPTDVITTARGQLVYKVFPVPNSAGAYVEHMNRLASTVQPPAELTVGTSPSDPAAVLESPANAARAAEQTSQGPAKGPADAFAPSAELSDTHRSEAGNPPLALDGFCPVTLIENRKWHAGNARWGAIHRGRTYLFAGQKEQQAFLAAPDRYAPVLNGVDPVLAFDQQKEQSGKREFGAFFENRVYLFSSEASYRQFRKNPARYAIDRRQAMRR